MEERGSGHGTVRETATPQEVARAAAQLESEAMAGRKLTPATMRLAMTEATGGSDSDGRWNWHEAYDAAESAMAGLIRRSAAVLRRRFPDNGALLGAVLRAAALETRQSVRSQRQLQLQQFSTPWGIAWPLAVAAAPPDNSLVLEPSAGTGVLLAAATLASGAGVRMAANEIDRMRGTLCARAFPQASRLALDATHIEDLWPKTAERPATVIMNPPFSRDLRHGGRALGADWRHVGAALRLLTVGGRLACVTSDTNGPHTPRVQAVLGRHPDGLAVRGSCRVAGGLYAPRGTTFDCRITIIDRIGGPPRTEITGPLELRAETPEELLAWVEEHIGTREPAPATTQQKLPELETEGAAKPATRRKKARPPTTLRPHEWGPIWQVAHQKAEKNTTERGDKRPYVPWRATGIAIGSAPEHPTPLVESAAMAAVPHARASYRPTLTDRIRTNGMLSEAQLESVVLAGEATERHIGGWWWISKDGHRASAVEVRNAPAPPDKDGDDAVAWRRYPARMRQGWMLGDGTGTGKGREVAGYLLDQWLRGRRRAIWFSQSDKLIADAQRDWVAMGGRKSDLIPLGRIRANEPIGIDRGIVFSTYATLRQPERDERRARLDQIIEWLAGGTGEDIERVCDAVIVFDESHALSNAAAREMEGVRTQIASQQGRAGLALQRRLPDARVLYVSATGATTIDAIAYAERLGLWGFDETPFRTRDAFMGAMDAGGVAALEIVARDLKAMGRYQARALAYTGVEIEPLDHALTDEQVHIYDSYAKAFSVIHKNLDRALEATGITKIDENGRTQTVNRAAKAAALSNFESTKQRFFSHLLSGMKCPSLIRAMEDDLAAGRRPVVQLVSTGEALMERRLATIPANQWDDLEIDLTPREYVLEYLRHSFPTKKLETVQIGDSKSDTGLRPVQGPDGKPVESAEMNAARDRMISNIAALPPVPTALDQIVQHFGHERVAEITGRSRRILRLVDQHGRERLAVRRRPESATLTDGDDFQAGLRDLLVFSGAGNTGRSYHADRTSAAPSRRVHYLLEPGWRADQAIQGLGRTHRTNQASAPMFRPVTTNVAGERRFIATIARRLDSLGAITRGQRTAQTAFTEESDQQLFRPEDNLESEYATAALRQLYIAICSNNVEGWTAKRLAETTGLQLQREDGGMLDRVPRIQKFLNRLVAMRIEDQNTLFAALEVRVVATIAEAKEKNTFRTGMETLEADSIQVIDEKTAASYELTDQTTLIVELLRRRRRTHGTAEEIIKNHHTHRALDMPSQLMVNTQSKHAAHVTNGPSRMLKNGGLVRYVHLHRAATMDTMPAHELEHTRWQPAPEKLWAKVWTRDVDAADPWIEDRWWLATGLLLPCWSRLPESSDMRVYRAECDDGRTLIGRVLTAGETRDFETAMGLETTIEMTMNDVQQHLGRTRSGLELAGGWRLRSLGVHQRVRVALYGPDDTDSRDLEAMGLTSEIIQWRTIWFVPDDAALDRLLEKRPLVSGTAERTRDEEKTTHERAPQHRAAAR